MSGKYWEKYQEKKLKLERSCKTPTHMSDKQAYISSLESQIEKSGSTQILVSTFAERIEQLQKQLNTAEERISNLTRIFKLQSTDNSDGLNGGLLVKIEERLSALEKAQKTKVDSYRNFSGSVDLALKETEKKIGKLIEDFEEKYRKSNGTYSFAGSGFVESLSKEGEKIVRDAAESAWLAQQTCNKLAEDTIDRVAGCDKRLRELKVLIENSSPDIEEIELKVTAKLDTSIENLSSLIKGYIKNQDALAAEIHEFKRQENIDPGVFSFGSTSPKPFQFTTEVRKSSKHKSESGSRETSKEKEMKGTRKRSLSPAPKMPVEKKAVVKKEEQKVRKKNERKNKLEKLYQNFSAKNT